MTETRHDYTTDCRRLVARLGARTVLCIGRHCEDVLEGALRGVQTSDLALEDLPRLAELGTFDFIFVADVLERVDRTKAVRLLASLRDLHGGRFAVLISQVPGAGDQAPWHMEDFLTLGLTLAAEYRQNHRETQLYLFDISTYKDTPDWLSPRFWANPERWNKEWW